MTLRVGINGFGRIGRGLVRALRAMPASTVEVVAVNDVASADLMAHLLRYDVMYGRWPGEIESDDQSLTVDGAKIDTFSQLEPGKIPWGKVGVDVVVESTGSFTRRNDAAAHLRGGAKLVFISAPSSDADATILFGMNHPGWDPETQPVISTGSCTSHAVAPLVAVLGRTFGWRHGHVTTVHPMTFDQSGGVGSVANWRLTRGSQAGVIPKATSAVSIVNRLVPEVRGRLSGIAYRIPTLLPGVVDLVAEVARSTDAEEVVSAFRQTERANAGRILKVSDEPLVSADYVGDGHSATVDARLVEVNDGTQIHLTAWYDNEAGYAHRLADLLVYAADHHAGARSFRSRVTVRGCRTTSGGRTEDHLVDPTRQRAAKA